MFKWQMYDYFFIGTIAWNRFINSDLMRWEVSFYKIFKTSVEFFLFLNNLFVYDQNRSIFEFRISNRNLDIVGTWKRSVELFIHFSVKSQINNFILMFISFFFLTMVLISVEDPHCLWNSDEVVFLPCFFMCPVSPRIHRIRTKSWPGEMRKRC